jgi:hypothetical protein
MNLYSPWGTCTTEHCSEPAPSVLPYFPTPRVELWWSRFLCHKEGRLSCWLHQLCLTKCLQVQGSVSHKNSHALSTFDSSVIVIFITLQTIPYDKYSSHPSTNKSPAGHGVHVLFVAWPVLSVCSWRALAFLTVCSLTRLLFNESTCCACARNSPNACKLVTVTVTDNLTEKFTPFPRRVPAVTPTCLELPYMKCA